MIDLQTKPRLPKSSIKAYLSFCLACLVTLCTNQAATTRAQVSDERAKGIDGQRERGLEMLREIKDTINKHYFDATYHGIALEKHFKAAGDQVATAISGDQIYGIVAHSLLAFDDSHTYFIPPVWSIDVDYGWEMQMFGERCLVVKVDGGSDAAAKGLRPGDRILAIFDIQPTRANLWQLEYLFYRLRPLNAIQVVAVSPGGKPRNLELFTSVTRATWKTVNQQQERLKKSTHYYKEWGDDLFVWKMGDFLSNDKGIDEMMKLVGQRRALILDLRGNGGGYEATLQRMVGYFFDHNVKLGDRRGRKESKPVTAATLGEKSYRGKLIVLVDSVTASAAELFARIIQLEKRGTVIGDRTAGAVRESKPFYIDYKLFPGYITSPAITYGVSVTINDLIMSDGNSLEHIGVMPDELLVPTAEDLANDRDPILLRAADILGIKLDR